MTIRRLFFVAIAAFCFTSCLNDIKEESAPLGVEAQATDVQNVVDKATGDITIATAQVNDCVTYEDNYRIETGEVTMTSLFKHKLMSIVDATDTVTFNLFEDYYNYFQSGAQKDEAHRQMTLPFKKSGTLTSAQIRTLDTVRPSKYTLLNNTPITDTTATNLCDGVKKTGADGVDYDCIKYYNLAYDDRTIPAPIAVQQKANCGGFANCQIPGHYLQYDMVKFLSGDVVKKVTLQGHFSSTIPDLFFIRGSDGSYSYTPAATSLCTTSLEPIGDTKYLVTFCSVLRDVSKASAGGGDCYPHTPGT